MSEASPVIQYLSDYVAIPSVNPMGRSDLPAEIRGESRLAEHLQAQLRRINVDAVLVGQGERKSVVAELECGNPPADTVLVASHIDTVPVDRMEIDPFMPTRVGDRLEGRGTCDTKAGMAAAVAALQRVLERGVLRRNVILVGEADEELSSQGVRDVLDHLGGRRPDWVLATEPTELRVIHAHKGVVHIRLEAQGRAGHASAPENGQNAVVALARAVVVLDDLGTTLQARINPLLGPATLSVGLVSGGHAPNIIPDYAWLVADRRSLPGETAESIRAEIEDALVRGGVEGVRVVACTTEKPPLGTAPDHTSVRMCRAALSKVPWPDEIGTVAFGTDAGVFGDLGLPGVVMGPGSIEQAHTSREWVDVRQVEAMADFFEALFSSKESSAG